MAPRVPVAAAALALIAACAEGPTQVAPEVLVPSLGGAAFHQIPANNPEYEFVVLCKSGPVGSYTFSATATHPVLLDEATGLYTRTSGTYTINVVAGDVIDGTTIPGSCYDYPNPNNPSRPHNHNALAGGSTDATVTIVETGIPSGVVFDKVEVTQKTGIAGTPGTVVTTSSTTNSASGHIGGDGATPATLFGASMIFYNIPAPPKALAVSKTASGTYDTKTKWDLTKTVSPSSHTGISGQVAGTSTWTVTATPVVTGLNYKVTGNITVNNPNDFDVTINVADALDDGTAGAVTCPVTNDATGTVPANGSLVCAYTASPSAGNATLNTATVTVTSPSGVSGGTATAPVAYVVKKQYGDQSVLLADPRFSYLKIISSATTVTFPETFSCKSQSKYGSHGSMSSSSTFGTYGGGYHDDDDDDYYGTRTEDNTAKLIGLQTWEYATAKVTITCNKPQTWKKESATGNGYDWDNTKYAPSTWFEYSPWYSTNTYRGIKSDIDLIAGKYYDAGKVSGTRGSTTSLTITLKTGFRFENASSNVKIHPMSCSSYQYYVSPGNFSVKKTASQSSTTFTVTGLPNTDCYGIHVDVERLDN